MPLNSMFLTQAASALGSRGLVADPREEARTRAIFDNAVIGGKKKRPNYTGAIPEIAKAYGDDPRTKLAESALLSGTSTAPVAQGGWAVTDGLARAAQAILGAYMQKKQGQKYGEKEAEMMDALKASAALAGGPQGQEAAQPAFANPTQGTKPPEAMAAQALAPAQMAAPAAPQGLGAPGSGTGPPAPSIPALSGPGAAQMGVPSGPASPRVLTPGQSARAPNARTMFRRGIVGIESNPNDPWRKSGDGAIGPAQVMPGTAPLAARLAGLPFDERRYKSDAEYNLALGEAYFNEQLKTFGDPSKAAAAYNAGPGNVRRAIRRAAKNGGSWEDYLPKDKNDDTRKYVEDFRKSIGVGAGQSYNANEDVSAVGQTAVPAPQMEAGVEVPDMPLQAPNAPKLPDPVQSQRIQMAQQMLNSDNPFLVQQARAYLDKGMDENFESSKIANEQRFTQGQTGYQAGLNDFTGARSEFRQNQYAEGRDVKARNFGRESDYNTRTFTASESAADRSSRAAIASADRAGTRSNIEYQEGQQNSRTAATIEGRAQTDDERRAEKRNIYLNTPTGLKMQDKVNTEISANEGAIGQFQRFLELNKRQGTGGMVLNTPIVGSTFSSYNSDLKEMNTIANKTTLSEIGGSLGVAISDGDRKFISESNISTTAPGRANGSVAKAAIAGLRRKNDYLNEFQNAQIEGTQAQFYKEWRAFAEGSPIVKNGKVTTTEPITFEQWRKSRPAYDINGKRVN